MQKKFPVKMIGLLLCVLFLTGSCIPVSADDYDIVYSIRGSYRSAAFPEVREWNYNYSDSYFRQSSDEYHHDLARLSFGLATSAFRNLDLPVEQQGDTLENYLGNAGFEDLLSEDYKTTPTATSVATVIGRKVIGDFTVIGVGICGGNYQKEWKSNLKVGDDTRHVGFNEASQKVQERIRTYLSDHQITGPVKLWISGFSRAAAISNITAADMTDSGLFTDVFAYTFATPRTTREPGSYPNIFNIVGKNDPVPAIPLADWGYQRYGVDLYTPSAEYDTDFQEKAALAELVSRDLSGLRFRVNPAVNTYLRNVLDYLYSIFPSSADYENNLQEIAIRLWGASSSNEIATNLLLVLQEYSQMATESKSSVNELLDYIQNILYEHVRGNQAQISAGYWDESATTADNLGHEHNPDTYLCWLYSTDDPSKLYSSDALNYYRMIISGENMTIDVYNSSSFVERITSKGQILTDPTVAGFPPRAKNDKIAQLYSHCSGKQVTLVLPQDDVYALAITVSKDETVKYITGSYSTKTLPAVIGTPHEVKIKANNTYYILVGDDLREEDSDSATKFWNENSNKYTPSMMISMENMNVFHLRVRDLFLVAGIVTLVLIIMILFSVFAGIIRRIRHAPRSAPVTIVSHAIGVLFFFVLSQLALYHLTRIHIVFGLTKAFASFFAVLLALKGYIEHRGKFSPVIIFFLFICMIGDCIMELYPLIGIGIFAVALIMLFINLLLEKKPSEKLIIAWLSIWVTLIITMVFFYKQLEENLIVYIFFDFVLVGTVLLAAKKNIYLAFGSILFGLSSLWQSVNNSFKVPFWCHIAAVALYYVSALVMASSCWTKDGNENNSLSEGNPETIPAEETEEKA